VVERVGGDADAEASWDPETRSWRSGGSEIETPLPEGYPPPTPPGALEIKRYPGVRRAEIDGTGRSSNVGFMPLFRHIQRNEIAMTAPVEMDYPLKAETASATGEWTMSFLYRTPDLHPVGTDEADPRIRIRDVEEMTVLSLGGRGTYDPSRILRDVTTLNEWIAQHPEWERAGDPRALLYNGPNMRPWMNWLEVQVPVRPRETAPEQREPAKAAEASL
jgi:hypothetical protein